MKDKKVNILLIDDDEKKRLTIRSILDDDSLNLIECNSGAEGLKQLLKTEFALILLDVKMPGMDGFETARWIRARPKTEYTPIIFISGYSSEDLDVTEGYSYGAVDFIFTPIKSVILKTKVQAFVDLYKKNRQVEQQNEELQLLRDHLEDLVEKRTAALEAEIDTRKKTEKKLKESLKEKEVLLAEIHHRVKNNMAVVSALLELEMNNLEEQELKFLLGDSLSRIRSMALLHEKLYQAGDFSYLEFNLYIEELVDKISSAYVSNFQNITTEIDADNVLLNLNQAIPCALALNELLINAYKHAFDNQEEGKIVIKLSEKDNFVELKVKDNGVGLPEDFKLNSKRTLGMQLVGKWVKQLQATLDVSEDNGATFVINFSKATHSDFPHAQFN